MLVLKFKILDIINLKAIKREGKLLINLLHFIYWKK